jgi:hypothetical protein
VKKYNRLRTWRKKIKKEDWNRLRKKVLSSAYCYVKQSTIKSIYNLEKDILNLRIEMANH